MTNLSIHSFDLPLLHRHAIGFDRLFDELNRSFENSRHNDNYPPYNVIKLDDTHYVAEVAVAGFKETELDVELKDGLLTIKGERAKPETEVEYQHRGISARNFVRTFKLDPLIEVRGATVQNGILSVALEHVVPEEKKPKKIQITFAK
jgi:molecular chaperone IbpA